MSAAVLRFEPEFYGVQVVQVVEAQRVFRTPVRISPWWWCSLLLLPGDASMGQCAGCWTLLPEEGQL